MMQSFGGFRIPYSKILIVAAGSFYTIAYSLSYKVMTNEVRIPRDLALTIFVLSEILLAGTILFCCAKLIIDWARNRNASDYGLLIPVFSIGTVVYMLFNTYVDVCFYFFEDRTVIWGINIYNLTVLYYIILNLVSIPLVYKRESFLNMLLGKGDSSPLSDYTMVEFQTSTILDSAEKYHLSAREIEVLNLIYRGKSNPDISSILFISNNTVKHHVNSIFKKMGVKNRYELLSIIKNEYHS
jgi:DNA-binding CsgD family transcriptional regulator